MKTLILVISIFSKTFLHAGDLKIEVKLRNLEVSSASGKSLIPLNISEKLHIQDDLIVSKDNDVYVVVVKAEDHEVATSVAYGISPNGQKQWTIDLNAFNPTPPLLAGRFVYLGVIDKIFKLDKMNGKIVWSHDKLYDNPKYQYDGHEAISKNGNSVVFSKKLKVNDKTGKIAEVLR